MKICLVHTMYYPHQVGGAELTVQQIAEGLAACGHDVVVVSAGKHNDVRVHNGVKIYELKLVNVYWPYEPVRARQLLKPLWHSLDTYNPIMARRLRAVLASEAPHYVQCHNLGGFSCAVWCVIKKMRLPVVQVLHDYYHLCVRSTMFTLGRNCSAQCFLCRAWRLPNRRLSRLVDVVVSVSHYVLDSHVSRGLFPNARRMVIHDGYTPVREEQPGSRGTPMRFGYIGRLHPTKGIDLLLEDFSALDVAGVELVIAGEGEAEYTAALKRRALGKAVRFLGYVRREDFYPQIDVLVVPSVWHDPFPGVCKEALAWGKPVIASRRGGIPEMVLDGETGLLFDPDQKGSLLAAMRFMVTRQNYYAHLSSACIKRACEFTEKKMVEAYEALARELGASGQGEGAGAPGCSRTHPGGSPG